jgi:hypothetical protein
MPIHKKKPLGCVCQAAFFNSFSVDFVALTEGAYDAPYLSHIRFDTIMLSFCNRETFFMKQIFISFVVAILLLSGCVTSTHKPKNSARSIFSNSNTANIHFNNTGVFDQDLKEAMSARVKTITVTVVGDISVNQMPERLEKWLSAVRYKGNTVEFVPEPKPKSPVFSIIAEIREFVNWLNEASWYEFAENYQALVFFEPREPKDGKIKRIEFRRKWAAGVGCISEASCTFKGHHWFYYFGVLAKLIHPTLAESQFVYFANSLYFIF